MLRAECVQLDPHPVVHEAITALLSRVGISLAAATISAEAALRALSLHHPELFVVEPLLAEADALDGLECIRRSLLVDPGLTVVALSGGAEAEWEPVVRRGLRPQVRARPGARGDDPRGARTSVFR
jgi:DNA-binding NarL/FixJ family response regulator